MIRQKTITIKFEGDIFEKGARADLIVENKVLPELKSLERLKNVQKSRYSPTSSSLESRSNIY